MMCTWQRLSSIVESVSDFKFDGVLDHNRLHTQLQGTKRWINIVSFEFQTHHRGRDEATSELF